MKKILILFLIIPMLLLSSFSFANTRDLSFETEVANSLYGLGLFKGTGNGNYELDKQPSRIEAVIMLIRLTGKEENALSRYWKHPFKDVPEWATKYVGYAYQYGLAKGISDTEFGLGPVDCTQYLTYTLRTLGYSDVGNWDFSWDNPYDLASNIGLLPSCIDRENFLRADAVCISYQALNCKTRNTGKYLCIDLIDNDVISQTRFNEFYEYGFLNKKDEYILRYSNNTSKQINTDIVVSNSIYSPPDNTISNNNATTIVNNNAGNVSSPYNQNDYIYFQNNYNSYNYENKDNINSSKRKIPNLYTRSWSREKIEDFLQDMAEELEDTVLLVASVDLSGTISFGTAFFINDDNYAITNYHVVKNSIAVSVLQRPDNQMYHAYIANYDLYNDLALLYIDGATNYDYLEFEQDCEVNDYAFTCGFPEDKELNMNGDALYKTTSSIVIDTSAYANGKHYIKTQNNTTFGNSGGPLINGKYGVIGVVTLKDVNDDYIYSIPAEKVIDFIDETDFEEFESSLNTIRKKYESIYSNSRNQYQNSYYNDYTSNYTGSSTQNYMVEKTTIKGSVVGAKSTSGVASSTSMNLVYYKNGNVAYNGNIVRITEINLYTPRVQIDYRVAERYNSSGMYYSSMRKQAEESSAQVYINVSGTFQISQMQGYKITIPLYVYNNGLLIYTDYLTVDITGRRVGDYVQFTGSNLYLPITFSSLGNYEIRLGSI